jgi:Tol biopolymer transport system component
VIAFVRGRTIYVIHASGGAIRRVFESDGDSLVSRPAWSPDGNWIAFAQSDVADAFSAIAVVSSTGGGFRYVTTGGSDGFSDEPDYEPDWSPDGSRIAFTRTVWFCGSCDADEIFSVATDGSDTQWVTTDTNFAASRPAWSPNGDRIAAETPRGLAVLTASGKLLRVLDPLGTEPTWQRLA